MAHEKAATAGGPLSADELDEIALSARAEIEASVDRESLEESARRAFGKHSRLAQLYKGLGEMQADERKQSGQQLLELRSNLEQLAAARQQSIDEAERARTLQRDRLEMTEVIPGHLQGHLHLVTQVREQLEEIFVGMGYEIAEGPELETDWFNFQALNIGEDHPARNSTDTFFVEVPGAEDAFLLRTHTSPVQVHLLERGRLPIYAVAPGRVYRRDTPDATHLPGFHQIEGLVVDRSVTMSDLSGTIETFVAALFGPTARTRLRPGYFPFTEPSAEFEISCQICGGEGCRTCSMMGWIELGGCGMVHPNVLRSAGIDSEEWTGFAFGFGIDRLAIMRYQIADIRSFVENDVRFLRQF
jgi:phenylalanyl-tRNA synthetase alpha chain